MVNKYTISFTNIAKIVQSFAKERNKRKIYYPNTQKVTVLNADKEKSKEDMGVFFKTGKCVYL